MKNTKLLGNLLLLLTAMIWGTAFVFQRAGMDSIEPFTFNAARMALAAVAVGLVSVPLEKRSRNRRPARSPEEERAYRKYTLTGGLCCGLFLTGGSLFQQVGLVYTSAGKAGFITALYMLLVPVISFLVFKRKNSWLVWAAVVLGLIGMYMLCVTENFTLTQGDILVIICAFMFSGHILCCDYFAPRGNAVRIAAIQFAVVTVFSAILAVIFEEPTVQKLTSAAIPILYCGLVSGGIGYTLQVVAQQFTDPTVASLLMSLESVFAAIGGALILHERMTSRETLGCIIMFTAIILVQVPLPGKGRAEPGKGDNL